MATTPTVKCPRCEHSINMHRRNAADAATTCCPCRMDPNLIAVALLFGDLTPTPGPQRVTRDPKTGDWS